MNESDHSLAPAIAPAAHAPPLQAQILLLHPQLTRVWRWGAVLAALPAIGIGSVVAAALGKPWIAALVIFVVMLVVVFIWNYARAYVARFRGRLQQDGLWVERGVWWRNETFVPRSRIQHTEVEQGPLARRYGMASLKLFTAGASHAEIGIDGLAHAQALALRDDLLGRTGHDGV